MKPPTHTQKLLFNAKMWTPASIRAWIASQPKSHWFTARKIELLRDDYHVRQRDPKDFVPSSFRTIPFGEVEKTGIQSVIGHLKAEEDEFQRHRRMRAEAARPRGSSPRFHNPARGSR